MTGCGFTTFHLRTVTAWTFRLCESVALGIASPMDDATRRGATIIAIPGHANRSVAEHAMAHKFAAARHFATMDRQVRAGVLDSVAGIELPEGRPGGFRCHCCLLRVLYQQWNNVGGPCPCPDGPISRSAVMRPSRDTGRRSARKPAHTPGSRATRPIPVSTAVPDGHDAD